MTERFSMELLELAFGVALLLLDLCTTLVVQLQVYPPLGFLTGFIAVPVVFRGAASLQKRLPELNDSTYSFLKYVMPGTFTACLAVPPLLIVVPEPFRGQTMPLFVGLTVAAGLLLM